MACVAIFVLFLYKICSTQAVGNPEPLFLSAKVGEAVTLHCPPGVHSSAEIMMWYKQRLNHSPLEVASRFKDKEPVISAQFDQSRFKTNKDASGFSLTIENVSKKDEGLYFCGGGDAKSLSFSTSTFLAVKDSNISVDQTPVLESVSSGESVTLQCTVLSEVSPEDLRVLWFRSAAGRSFPEIIYTDYSSSSRQCETSSSPHSCVYNFSKNILNDDDAGTYYCAVTTCGKIIIGNGTAVGLIHHQPVLGGVFLGLALGLSLFGNIIQACWSWRRGICSGETSQSGLHDFPEVLQDQDDEDEFCFAASHFSEKMKRAVFMENVFTKVRFTPFSLNPPSEVK
ncbi:uncharacterized protein [Salminus brasiliensis]|uniref:uncharacterized protein n=1 Tax=Salminus brasiliensis TaxID=930266 RepID=UPI003B82E9DD